jgi:hypothetical protein
MISIRSIQATRLSSELVTEHSRNAQAIASRELCENVTTYAQTGIVTRTSASASGRVHAGKGSSLLHVSLDLAMLAVLLLRRPFDLAPVKLSDLTPTSEIAVVLLAAHTRILIAEGKAVSVLELATVAGVDESSVRKCIRSGEIESTQLAARSGGHQIKASIARAWLAMRHVSGFEAVKGKKKLRHVTAKEARS